MNTIKTAAAALLIASLPFAPTAFARDRGHGDDRYGQARYEHRHDHHWRHAHRHHDRHYYRHHQPHRGHNYGYGYETRGGWDYRPKVVAPQVVLPLPPLPPVPVIVLKKHHDARIVLRHPY